MRELLIILGAGATHDYRAFQDDDERPPLAKDLFHPRFASLQSRYPGVVALVNTIRRRCLTQPLETVLADLLDRASPDIQRHAREIPYYLRDVIWHSTARSDPNHFDDLFLLLQEMEIRFFVATMNYDRLVEEALSRIFRYRDPWTLDTFTRRDRQWQVVKLHGSIDWAYPQDRTWQPPDRNSFGANDDAYRTALLDSLPTEIERGDLQMSEPFLIERDARYWYPALAVPSDRKYGFVCPPEHREALADFVRRRPAVLVIGSAGNDEDLMQFLSDEGRAPTAGPSLAYAMPSVPFHVVDPGENRYDVAQRFSTALGLQGYQLPSEQGFQGFLDSREADRFLEVVAAAPPN